MANLRKTNKPRWQFQSKSFKTGAKGLGQPEAKVVATVKKSGKKGYPKTPRPYLSWSQLSLWERDPMLYKQVYIDGVKEESEALSLGSSMAQAMEDGKGIDDPIIQQGLLLFQRYQKSEFQIKVKTEVCDLLSKLDSFDPKGLRIREYKTGKWPWTQGKVDKHGQLTFYAYVVYLKYKKLPSEIFLDWLDTDPESKNYGVIKTFKTVRTLTDLIKFSDRLNKAWKGIIELCKENENAD